MIELISVDGKTRKFNVLVACSAGHTLILWDLHPKNKTDLVPCPLCSKLPPEEK